MSSSHSRHHDARKYNKEDSRAQKRPNKQEPSTGGSSSSSNNASGKPKTSAPAVASFLFVVNEFDVDWEMEDARDQWLNYMPPLRADAYRGEHAGSVFRYRGGVVSLAPEFRWHRPGMGQEGRIARMDERGGFAGYLQEYKTQSIFSCSAHLPIIVLQGDACLGSFMRRCCPCDAQQGDRYSWNMLHFDHRDGRSFATSNSQGFTYVAAGRSPSWVPALVPKVFANSLPGNSALHSRGLSGDLPIIIALMAFHSNPGHASDVFRRGMWQQGQWRGPSHSPIGYPSSDGCPRGFVVQVCLETIEGEGDLRVAERDPRTPILDLEWRGVLVEG